MECVEPGASRRQGVCIVARRPTPEAGVNETHRPTDNASAAPSMGTGDDSDYIAGKWIFRDGFNQCSPAKCV